MQRTPPPRYRPPLKRPQLAEGTEPGFAGRCPHLGTLTDPGTALAFPSASNQCYKTRLPVPISMVHQEAYCLSSNYTECPVFQQALAHSAAAPLAAELFVTAPPSWPIDEGEIVTDIVIGPSRRPKSRVPVLPLVLLLVLLAGGWWLWRGYLVGPNGTANPSQRDLAIGETTAVPETAPVGSGDGVPGQAVAVANATSAPPPTSTPLPTQAARPASNGISLPVLPTVASAASAGVALAADCTTPEWWMPYTVLAGETLAGLAQLRGLTADDILLGNCLANAALAEGQVILLPPLAVVVELSPTATATRRANTAPATRAATRVPAATATAVVPASPTPVPTLPPSDTPEPPEGFPTNPPPPTATAVVIPSTPTATPPPAEPTATPPPPRPTVTPPIVNPTATPPYERPTQTPTPVQP